MVLVTSNTNAAPNNVPAVGTTYTGGGYEFDGQIYAGLNAHSGVGGTDGPCVGCHMSGTAGHTWNAVTKNETTGEVTAINSSVCAGCHGANMTPAALNAKRAELTAALDDLEAQLNARGIFFNPASSSGFFKDAAFTTAADNAYYASQAQLAPAVTTRDLQGAAFNLYLFKHPSADPGGYVHNPPYALKLVKDSADLLNDGLIDGDF
jgi:formate-dependent nitrite reductase cytochrome c552 subunit